ncbi:Linker histone H1/H5 [Macleaya cordata]|uniref:Linker histone H1/H5 n=1 Tax=Macleaya cordata TaxID=56857 RepID=A0A200QR85_MACCD|nr:Linker histone H1/H5 [Macleaya cordata]
MDVNKLEELIVAAEAEAKAHEVEQPEKADEEKAAAPAKVPKEKKPMQANASQKPSHPPYFQMIKEAVLALDEESGSSPYAIAKFMEQK